MRAHKSAVDAAGHEAGRRAPRRASSRLLAGMLSGALLGGMLAAGAVGLPEISEPTPAQAAPGAGGATELTPNTGRPGDIVALPALPDAPSTTTRQLFSGNGSVIMLDSKGRAFAYDANGNQQPFAQVRTPADDPIVEVYPGERVSFAKGQSGKLYGWGMNDFGVLGASAAAGSVPATAPVEVDLGATPELSRISSTGYTAIGFDENGVLYAWGSSNDDGLLGSGPNQSLSSLPVPVALPAGVDHFVDAKLGGWYFGVALGDNGTLYEWGTDVWGSVASGFRAGHKDMPTEVQFPEPVEIVEFGVGRNFALALDTNGALWQWGDEAPYSPWGNQDQSQQNWHRTSNLPPQKLAFPAGIEIARIKSGAMHAFVESTDGRVFALGFNRNGAFGVEGPELRPGPVEVTLPVDFGTIELGHMQSLGIDDQQRVIRWGGADGQPPSFDTILQVPVGERTITAVTFGGVAAELSGSLSADGVQSVEVPDGSGEVDVVIEWAIDGVPQPPITISPGFTYAPPPVLPTLTASVAFDGAPRDAADRLSVEVLEMDSQSGQFTSVAQAATSVPGAAGDTVATSPHQVEQAGVLAVGFEVFGGASLAEDYVLSFACTASDGSAVNHQLIRVPLGTVPGLTAEYVGGVQLTDRPSGDAYTVSCAFTAKADAVEAPNPDWCLANPDSAYGLTFQGVLGGVRAGLYQLDANDTSDPVQIGNFDLSPYQRTIGGPDALGVSPSGDFYFVLTPLVGGETANRPETTVDVFRYRSSDDTFERILSEMEMVDPVMQPITAGAVDPRTGHYYFAHFTRVNANVAGAAGDAVRMHLYRVAGGDQPESSPRTGEVAHFDLPVAADQMLQTSMSDVPGIDWPLGYGDIAFDAQGNLSVALWKYDRDVLNLSAPSVTETSTEQLRATISAELIPNGRAVRQNGASADVPVVDVLAGAVRVVTGSEHALMQGSAFTKDGGLLTNSSSSVLGGTSGDQTRVLFDPIAFQPIGAPSELVFPVDPSVPGGDRMFDLASCATPPTLRTEVSVTDARFDPADQFVVSSQRVATTGDVDDLVSAVTDGSSDGALASTAPAPVLASLVRGDKYRVMVSMAPNSQSELSTYLAQGAAPVCAAPGQPSRIGVSSVGPVRGVFELEDMPGSGAAVSCEFTLTGKPSVPDSNANASASAAASAQADGQQNARAQAAAQAAAMSDNAATSAADAAADVTASAAARSAAQAVASSNAAQNAQTAANAAARASAKGTADSSATSASNASANASASANTNANAAAQAAAIADASTDASGTAASAGSASANANASASAAASAQADGQQNARAQVAAQAAAMSDNAATSAADAATDVTAAAAARAAAYAVASSNAAQNAQTAANAAARAAAKGTADSSATSASNAAAQGSASTTASAQAQATAAANAAAQVAANASSSGWASSAASGNAQGVAPVFLTDPHDVTVNRGETATFTVTVAGDPTPSVAWERQVPQASGMAGVNGAAPWVAAPVYGAWQPVTTGVSGDGLTFTVSGGMLLNGARYRAIATNVHGTVTSQTAMLTVLAQGGTNDKNADGSGNADAWSNLAFTGESSPALLWWGASILLIIGGATTAWGVRKRITQR